MATLKELKDAIDALIDHPLGPGSYKLIQDVEGKAYEAYIFCLCLEAVRTLKVTPLLRGSYTTPDPFIFRGAPGKIHSEYRNYGYASFTLNGHEFEIHTNVEFRGKSGMIHEIDVCLMNAKDAKKCRDAKRRGIESKDPPSSSLVGVWECKFYDYRLDKVLARAFVGLVSDLSSNVRLSGLCSNQTHPQIKQYYFPKNRPYPHLQLTPLNPENEDLFIKLLSAELKRLAT